MNDLLSNLLQTAPKPYIPEKLPIDYYQKAFSDTDLLKSLQEASMAIGEYKGYLMSTINPSLLISPLIANEAVESSKLEGTHATLEDLFNYDADQTTAANRDEIKEVANYRRALFYAMDNISVFGSEDNKMPLCTRVIKEMHSILLDNVRGSSKRPGEFKRQQNYIVSADGVVFTPLPANLVNEYMSNLENYIHFEDFNTLLQIAIIHCQFEMIHPFEDGNGRIGRLLIPLFLYYRDVLPLPTFYMSNYFSSNRQLYLESLNSVSTTGEWNRWFKYFLNGIRFSAKESTIKAVKINDLYDQYKELIINQINSSHGIQLLDFIFQHPYFTAKSLIDKTGIPRRTAYLLLNKLCNLHVLSNNGKKRNTLYLCDGLIKLL